MDTETNPADPTSSEPPTPTGAVALQRQRPGAPTRRRYLWFAALTVVTGILGGLVWHGLVTLPTYSVSDNGGAQITERALGQVFATDGVYVVIGMLGGLMLGFAAWRLFRLLGWPVGLIAVAGGLVAGGICWFTGVSLGPNDFAGRISTAQPGQLVPVDFQLHTTSALFVWGLGAIVPVMLYANLSKESDEPVRRRRSAAAQGREASAEQRGEVDGTQFN